LADALRRNPVLIRKMMMTQCPRRFSEQRGRFMNPVTQQGETGREVDQIKDVLDVYQPESTHMVGDGFHVRNLFPSHDLDRQVSPFLLLDYAGPTYYPPTNQPRGVSEHPHRGFETVTIVYQGVLEHRDSTGHAGTIGPGDVQWMTAASGVVHEEMHERAFAQRGGTLQAIQLWVNLPGALKMSPPRYQTLLNSEIPVVHVEGGSVRVIAGEFQGVKGPAKTFTPIHLYDLRLRAGYRTELILPAGHNTALFLLNGNAVLNGVQCLHEAELAVFGTTGERIAIEVKEDVIFLVLNGQSIDEPVARHGPFVMNTQDELIQAVKDNRMGKMGQLD
jgi:quercetin 2,3-dioxygenase